MARRQDGMAIGIFLLSVSIAIYLYLQISEIAAIILLAGGIIILLLLILSQFPRLIPYLRFPLISSKLKKHSLIWESQFTKKYNIKPGRLNRALFLLSKSWTLYPLVLLVEKEYLYLSNPLVQRIVKLVYQTQASDESNIQDVIKMVRKNFKLSTRAEATAIVRHISKITGSSKNTNLKKS